MSERSIAPTQQTVAPVVSPLPGSGLLLQRQCACGQHTMGGECEECKKKNATIQRKATDSRTPSTVPPIVYDVLRSPGEPLDVRTRRSMETGFGRDFSTVRVHTDSKAADSASAVGAHAYTVGHDVVFAAHQYAPTQATGQRLIAHELSHVVQQSGNLQRSSAPLRLDTSGEAEAEIAAANVMNGHRAAISLHQSGILMQRQLVESLPRVSPRVTPRVTPRIGPMLPGESTPAPLQPNPGLGDTEPDVKLDEDMPEQRLDADEELGGAPEPENAGPEPTQKPQAQPQTQPVPPVIPAPDKEKEQDKDPCTSGKLPKTLVTWSVGAEGQAKKVTADPLTMCPGNTIGSIARRSVYKPQFLCVAKNKKSRVWYPCHLLHGATRRTGGRNLHGPGDTRWNIIIGDVGLNSNMYQTVEKWTLFRVYDLKQVLWLDSEVTSYFPGNEFFAKGIRVTYGLKNAAGGRGPQLDSQVFSSTETPPVCPSTPLGILTPRTTGTSKGPFGNTINICQRELRSRDFEVQGGLTVVVRAVPEGQNCSISDYVVELWKNNGRFWPDGQMSRNRLPAGNIATLTWRNLSFGEYYLKFVVDRHAANCCLKGEVAVTQFGTGATLA
jgi:Domain of unknown function (DUF4157)